MKLPLPLVQSAVTCSNTKGKFSRHNSVAIHNGFIVSETNQCVFACPLDIENPIDINLTSSELKLLLDNTEKLVKGLTGYPKNCHILITKESDQYAKAEIKRDDGHAVNEAMISIAHEAPIDLSKIEIGDTHHDICLHYNWNNLIKMQSIAKKLGSYEDITLRQNGVDKNTKVLFNSSFYPKAFGIITPIRSND